MSKETFGAAQIKERTASFAKDGGSPMFMGLVRLINEKFLPNLPADFNLTPGKFNAYPGTLGAVVNYLAAEYGYEDYLSTAMDLEPNSETWYNAMSEIYDKDPQRFNQIAQERLHIVNYPLRISPLQYIYGAIGGELTVADVGAAANISLPLLNSDLIKEQDFEGKDAVVASLAEKSFTVKMGIGIELAVQDKEFDKWVKAGFWRNPGRKDRLIEFEKAQNLARENREKFPIVQANAMEQSLKPHSLDAISAIFTVHQLPDPEAFFHVSHAVLKPGGILVVIGEELRTQLHKKQHPGWQVDIYVNSSNGLEKVASPFYLTENQATIQRADLSEWRKYLGN